MDNMMRDSNSDSGDFNRRKVLKNFGLAAATGLGITGATGNVAAKPGKRKNEVKKVTGGKRNKYIEKATSEIESERYSRLRERLSQRGYVVEPKEAVVTRNKTEKKVNVLLPLVCESEGTSIGSLQSKDDVSFGHIVWSDASSSEAFAVVDGDAETVAANLGFVSDSAVPEGGAGSEVI